MPVLQWLRKEPGPDRPRRSVLVISPSHATVRGDLTAASAGSS